ncbi:glycoside hydrolase family 30 protein [Flavobacterium sp. S87F.05.LMB.W.Kidney.N]|uniref:glycoside hydrolase family 30 protein n=1 Tax=Flavobacterium sp. S87F.05.LMB.W.Kidney.N TaxID=1278758 RepID=UPI0010670F2D|nr:glycoside hydrolase family 30 protein [Flavobacterium sp. S87F.05.LMB.W.Kidney.N]TDX14029.1 glucosylceramidase [Flavobacterium sp. S87F.05.LMB.W.Kidney.N]
MKTTSKICLSAFILVQLSSFTSTVTAQKTNASSQKKNKIKVFTTAENTNWNLSLSNDLISNNNTTQQKTSTVSIIVNTEKTDQTFLGIGGAITDASAEVFAKLSPKKQREFLNAYYDKTNGIGYSLARTNIHSCDFSSDSYTYIAEGDKDLKTFNIDHDRKYRIPLIKKAIETAGGKLTLFASPWSPPAFMKDNNDILHGGVLLPEFAPSWALYYAKFIKAYEKEGIPIWGLTVQNEPMAKQSWESCIYTPEAERDFLKNHLGPTLEKEGLGSKKVIIWDHNRGDMLEKRANLVFSDPEVSKYAWGIGFHWYETWNGGPPQFESVAKVHEEFPNKNLIFTEGCIEKFDAKKYQFWGNAERYGINMINDFNNGTVAWTDWNILLDQNGGPNHVGNFCFAPIHADTTKDELIYTPMYYYIGHFSKFIRPNAKRVIETISDKSLLSTSFKNSDGQLITIVMNQSEKEIVYAIENQTTKNTITIPAHAIQTVVF